MRIFEDFEELSLIPHTHRVSHHVYSFLPVRSNKSVIIIDLSAYDPQVPFIASLYSYKDKSWL